MAESDEDLQIAALLRERMADRGVSIRAMATAIGSPYRTLQDQLRGKNKMPASVYLRILSELGSGSGSVVPEELDEEALASGLEDALRGELLPVLKVTGPGTTSMTAAPSPDTRNEERRMADARRLAFFVAFGYHAARKAKTPNAG